MAPPQASNHLQMSGAQRPDLDRRFFNPAISGSEVSIQIWLKSRRRTFPKE
jgi:hypothetical protein